MQCSPEAAADCHSELPPDPVSLTGLAGDGWAVNEANITIMETFFAPDAITTTARRIWCAEAHGTSGCQAKLGPASPEPIAHLAGVETEDDQTNTAADQQRTGLPKLPQLLLARSTQLLWGRGPPQEFFLPCRALAGVLGPGGVHPRWGSGGLEIGPVLAWSPCQKAQLARSRRMRTSRCRHIWRPMRRRWKRTDVDTSRFGWPSLWRIPSPLGPLVALLALPTAPSVGRAIAAD